MLYFPILSLQREKRALFVSLISTIVSNSYVCLFNIDFSYSSWAHESWLFLLIVHQLNIFLIFILKIKRKNYFISKAQKIILKTHIRFRTRIRKNRMDTWKSSTYHNSHPVLIFDIYFFHFFKSPRNKIKNNMSGKSKYLIIYFLELIYKEKIH